MEPVDGRQALRIGFTKDEQSALAYAATSILARHLYEETTSAGAFITTEGQLAAPAIDRPAQISARRHLLKPADDPRFASALKWGSQLGEVMTSPGDVDGDGWADLAVLADFRVVHVFFLDSAGEIRGKSELEPERLGLEGTWFGGALAPAGDFDRDGVPDLLIGAPARDKKQRGSVLILCLNRDGNAKDVRTLQGDAFDRDLPMRGGLGGSLCPLGDLDRNGTIDLAVGIDGSIDFDFAAPLEKKAPAENLLPILFLDASGAVVRANSIRGRDFLELDPGVTFADSLAEVGDLDDDGCSELAIGYPFASDGGEYRGAVWIVFLERDGTVRDKQKISDWNGNFEASLRDEDNFGATLAAPGDLDSDGVPDLVVGGSKELWILLLRPDGSVKGFRQFGTRAGGFVPTDRVRSLAVLREGSTLPRLAVGARNREKRQPDSMIWILALGPGPTLSQL